MLSGWVNQSIVGILRRHETTIHLHGTSLIAGEHVYDKLLLIVDALGNTLATDLNSKIFAHYRDKRLTGKIL